MKPNVDGNNTARPKRLIQTYLPRKGPEMKMLTKFLNEETGAVTVDWVVLTAAIVGLGLLVFNFVRPSVSNLASSIGTELGDAQTCLLSNTSITC
jgi:Flp pilus assembly pilin Flp